MLTWRCKPLPPRNFPHTKKFKGVHPPGQNFTPRLCDWRGRKGRTRDLKTAKPIHPCALCKHNKITDAFPCAQVEQADANTKQICLKCLQTRDRFFCNLCNATKERDGFQPQVLTLPGYRPCLAFQPRKGERKKGRTTCRACAALIPRLRGAWRDAPTAGQEALSRPIPILARRVATSLQAAGRRAKLAKRYCPRCRKKSTCRMPRQLSMMIANIKKTTTRSLTLREAKLTQVVFHTPHLQAVLATASPE